VADLVDRKNFWRFDPYASVADEYRDSGAFGSRMTVKEEKQIPCGNDKHGKGNGNCNNNRNRNSWDSSLRSE